MGSVALENSLHRLVKEALDSGAAASLEDAEALFRRLILAIDIDGTEAGNPQSQTALLTAVALARRVFLGGVWVSGTQGIPLLVPMPLGKNLTETVITLGGNVGTGQSNIPRVSIGGSAKPRSAEFHVRTAQAGWRGGILPVNSELVVKDGPDMPLAAVLAAALAVHEAFRFARTGNPAFGQQPVGMSLWNASSSVDWLTITGGEPVLSYLPSRLWLIGLGHLGQAFLWALGLLPYSDPAEVFLVLQDIDVVTASTESTSILTTADLVGRQKTRVMADWAERRGFKTAVLERCFAADFKRQPEEPRIALCGLDNALGRRALGKVGFDLVVEAGLGRGHRDYRAIRLHALPGPKSAEELWKMETTDDAVADQPGYQKMLKDRSLDQCGITLLAGKAVGAPFVGAVASCLGISEVLRLLHGGTIDQVIDIDLQGIEHRSVVSHPFDFSHLNPSFVDVRTLARMPKLGGSRAFELQ